MKNLLFKLVKKLFREQMDHELKVARLDAHHEAREIRRQVRIDNEFMMLEMTVGEAVICLSNEVEVPVIGFAKRVDFITQSQFPTLVVHDYITDKEVLVLGSTYFYSKQLFDLVFDADMNAIISLIYSARYTATEVHKEPLGDMPFMKDVVIKKLQSSGFYEELETKQALKNETVR